MRDAERITQREAGREGKERQTAMATADRDPRLFYFAAASRCYEGELEDGVMVCREQMPQQRPVQEQAPNEGAASTAAPLDPRPAQLPPSAVAPLPLLELPQLLATTAFRPLKDAEPSKQEEPLPNSRRQAETDSPSTVSAISAAAAAAAAAPANSEQLHSSAPETIVALTVTSMQFNTTVRRKPVTLARVRLVCAHLSPSRRCAFVPLADLAQMALRPGGASLQADKLEQSYGKCQLHITNARRSCWCK